jgi:hypothetical protein
MTRKFFIMILSLLLCIPMVSTAAAAEQSNLISLKKVSGSVEKGDTFQVTVQGERLKDLYGIEVLVAYDAARLKVTGTVHHVEEGYPVIKDQNPMILAHTLTGVVPGISGEMPLFTITFEATGVGVATIDVTSVSRVVLENGKQVSYESTMDDGITVPISSRGTNPSPDNPNPTPSSPTPSPTHQSSPVIKVEAEKDTNGVAAVAIQREALQRAIQGADDKQVRIEVKPEEGTKAVQVSIPVESILLAGNKKLKSITVDTGLATVAIDPMLLKNRTDAASANLELSVATVDPSELPEAVKERLGEGAIVYDFNLSVGGSPIESFHGNTVTVGIPYALKSGENPNKVIIHYITDDGKLEVVKNGKYNPATGLVEFKPKHFSKYAAAYADVTFSDIADVDWAKDAIEGMAARTMVQGIGEGKFLPDGSVTRAQFITMLMNAFDQNDVSAPDPRLTDVKPGTWYYTSIASARQLGIVHGITESTFGIDDPISRQDMAVMLFRTMKVMELQLEKKADRSVFADQSSISGYAAEAVGVMKEAGIIQGIGEGRFAPMDQATRAQAAVILYRLLGYEG